MMTKGETTGPIDTRALNSLSDEQLDRVIGGDVALTHETAHSGSDPQNTGPFFKINMIQVLVAS